MTAREDDTPRVVAFPPLIFGGFLVVGLALDWLWPLGTLLEGTIHYVLGACLVLAGIAVGLLGERALKKAGTNVSPYEPTLAIVSQGVYAYSRNPLYLAFTMIFAGIALLANGSWTLLMIVPFVIVIRYGVIAREEAYLERKFGETYREYKNRARRWV